ncbi:MAG: DMP19 family protein [Hyphomonadaceae bacterium]
MSSGREPRYEHLVIDDAVIARDDPMAVIDPIWWIANFYDSYGDLEESLKGFSWPQRLVWAVMWHDSEVCNGGHLQFFDNSTGMIWPDALEGYEAIGRPDLAAVVREAVARFSEPPSRERIVRQEQVERDEPEFDDLDRRFYDGEGGLRDALIAFIKKQPEAFYFDGVVKKP